ncbi:MAG: hypothetical protein ABI824_01060 [Acidobacteriota bacterium]
MERKELARKVARSQNLPVAEAQDQVDELVDQLIARLRTAGPVKAPQLETLLAAPLADESSTTKPQSVAEIRAASSRIAKSRNGKP